MNEGIEVRRARREDLAAIAALVQGASPSHMQVDEAGVLDWLFSKGLLVALQEDALVGVAAWQAENLVSVTDVFCISSARPPAGAGERLLEAIEAEANTLMCEVNVVLLPASASEVVRAFFRQRGYESGRFEELHRIWREVLSEFVAADKDLMVKRLRDRMVMAPP